MDQNSDSPLNIYLETSFLDFIDSWKINFFEIFSI